MTAPTNKIPRVIVSFPVGEGDDLIIERMHAVVQPDGTYLLDNSPFYVFGISCGDVFTAKSEGGVLVFSSVVSRGGHSTYRIKLPRECDHSYFLKNWAGLQELGCTYEGSSANQERLYSIDVPADVDVFEVYRLLEQGEINEVWLFEEGHYFDPLESSI